jgi:hypothetical protein
MVFLNSPYRKNGPKRTKKSRGKKSPDVRLVGGWVWELANARAGPSFFWPAPRYLRPGLLLISLDFLGYSLYCSFLKEFLTCHR